MTRDEFLRAWKRWDAQPRNEAYALAMVVAARKIAKPHGLTSMVLRRRLSAGRREGLSYEDAFDKAVTK